MTEPTAQDSTQAKRDNKGRFLPGVSGNPGGSIGKNKCARDIEAAIEEFERERGISYWKAATLIAMKLADKGNTALLSKILDKFIGSKVELEGMAGMGENNIIIVRADERNKTKGLPGPLPIQR